MKKIDKQTMREEFRERFECQNPNCAIVHFRRIPPDEVWNWFESKLQSVFEEIEKEVIGGDEFGWSDCMGDWHSTPTDSQKYVNDKLAEQRQKLESLRQKYLGSKEEK